MLRDNGTFWDALSEKGAANFLWGEDLGPKHPARLFVRDWIKTHYKTRPTLLDIPCGAGVDRHVLGDIVDYTGLDRTQVILDGIRQRFPGITVYHGDIRDIPLQDNTFDIVYARAIFEHLCDVDDVEQAMKECFRVARKHCIFSFFIPLIDSPTEIDWNGKYFNNRYNREEVEEIINGFPTKDLDYKHIGTRGTHFIDSYDIFILKK